MALLSCRRCKRSRPNRNILSTIGIDLTHQKVESSTSRPRVSPIGDACPDLRRIATMGGSPVVGRLDYTILFMLGGGMWIFVASRFLEVLGISIRDDAIERNNLAALVAVCGILSGVGIVYALSNVGTGATIWTTLLPGFVATIALFLMYMLVEFTGEAVTDAITIDRDVASGLRLGSAVLGCSIILGHAAAGDWASWNQTWRDLADRGWPAVPIAIAAGGLQRMLRPTAHRPQPGILKFGVVPATLVLAAGFLVVVIWR